MIGCNTHLLKHMKQAILVWLFRQNIFLGCYPEKTSKIGRAVDIVCQLLAIQYSGHSLVHPSSQDEWKVKLLLGLLPPLTPLSPLSGRSVINETSETVTGAHSGYPHTNEHWLCSAQELVYRLWPVSSNFYPANWMFYLVWKFNDRGKVLRRVR